MQIFISIVLQNSGFLSEQEDAEQERVLTSIGITPRQYTGVYAKNVKFKGGVLQPNKCVSKENYSGFYPN